MTVLGSFVFAASILDDIQFHRESEALMFADGRISSGSDVIIDTAPKIKVLEIRVTTNSQDVIASKIAVGYAGTSALVALSVLDFAAHVLCHLRGEALPTIDQVASFLAQALKVSVQEYSRNQMRGANATFLVCQYDDTRGVATLRHIRLRHDGECYLTDISEPKDACTVVSGPPNSDLYSRICHQVKSRADRQATSDDAEHLVANQVELFVRANTQGRPFGGQLQICRIGSFGAQLVATQVWDTSFRRDDLPSDWKHGDYRTTMLGYDVFDLRVGQCDFVAQHKFQLPDSSETSWAKEPFLNEDRPPDDGDFFSRPRAGVVNISMK